MQRTQHLFTAFAFIYIAIATACLEEVDDSSIETDIEQLEVQPQRHCNVGLTATRGGGPELAPSTGPVCFDTFSEAIFAATKGKVKLAPDVTPESIKRLPSDELTTLGTYLTAIEYVAPRWDTFWGSINFVSSVTCDQGYTLSRNSLHTIGWGDRISSVFTLPGCAHAFHYEHINFGGARLDCHPAPSGGGDPCYYNLGALDDRTSSIRWTNSPF